MQKLKPRDSGESAKSNLVPDGVSAHNYAINGDDYAFVDTVVSEDHQTEPFWFNFLVDEMPIDERCAESYTPFAFVNNMDDC